jgi:hypothetical protein
MRQVAASSNAATSFRNILRFRLVVRSSLRQKNRLQGEEEKKVSLTIFSHELFAKVNSKKEKKVPPHFISLSFTKCFPINIKITPRRCLHPFRIHFQHIKSKWLCEQIKVHRFGFGREGHSRSSLKKMN